MKKLFLPLVLIIVVLPFITLLSGCNVSGFFTTYEDDPVYESPIAQDAAAAKGGADGADASPGATTFKQVCATCHQAKGQGVPGTYPPLAGSALAQNADATKPIRIVLHGFQGQIERNGKTYNGVMAAWSQLTDQEIAEVLSYVRSSWGNSAAAVTPDEVKAARDQTSGRSSAYTESELN
ncbi:MAG: cytochrome c [Ignavibacteria bacterium]|nr:cytochrome c [Ignavibacteria bacterium]